MEKEYKGTIIEESLVDNRMLNELEIIGFRISEEENPAERWHLYDVKVSLDDIDRLAENIKPKWYMHFWRGKFIIAIFQGQKFEFNYDDKESWAPAVAYGLSIGIPKEQLDFPIDDNKQSFY
jgi:hypothetical protein